MSTTEIQVTKAWEAAYAPAKTIPMNLMMMWMSGNSVQIFSMMVVAMMIMNPLKGIMSMHGGMCCITYDSLCSVSLPPSLPFAADDSLCVVPSGLHGSGPVQMLEHGTAAYRKQRLAGMVPAHPRTCSMAHHRHILLPPTLCKLIA